MTVGTLGFASGDSCKHPHVPRGPAISTRTPASAKGVRVPAGGSGLPVGAPSRRDGVDEIQSQGFRPSRVWHSVGPLIPSPPPAPVESAPWT